MQNNVPIIMPNQIPEVMPDQNIPKIRVAVYARVSTEHEEQINALENQLEWYKHEAKRHPEWYIVKWYVDEGITGTSVNKRPEFLKMLCDAKAGLFDLIITREVSRFARNTVDTLQYTRELKAKGIEVFFINDNIRTLDSDGELRLTIMATLAQDESRKTSTRVKAGQEISMKNGIFYGNGNILGYKRKETIISENKKEVDFIIDPEQAETVRMIFNMYLSGYGLEQIKRELELQGRLTAMGKKIWYASTISNILKNTFYCGVITYHKEFVPDYLDQKKIKNHGEIEHIKVKGKHEPLITEEEFEKVQEMLAGKRNKQSKGKPRRKTTWGRLLMCSCGNSFNRRPWNRSNGTKNWGYQCHKVLNLGSYSSRLKRGLSVDDACQAPMIPEWKLQLQADYIFNSHLCNPEKVLEIATAIIKNHIDDEEGSSDISDNTLLIERTKSEINKTKASLERLIDMRADGEITKEKFLSKKAEYEEKLQSLEHNLKNLIPAPKEESTPSVSNDEKLLRLKSMLKSYVAFDGGSIPETVVEAFVRKIVVSKDSFDWYLRLDESNLDGPIRCTVEGKRKSNAKVSSLSVSPSFANSTTGSNKRLMEKGSLKIAELTIGYEYALRFVMMHYPEKRRVNHWHDVKINLYI